MATFLQLGEYNLSQEQTDLLWSCDYCDDESDLISVIRMRTSLHLDQ